VDGPDLYRYARCDPVGLNDPSGTDPPSADPLVRVTPSLTDVSITGIEGDFQIHDLLSPDRSVSGRGGISLTGRSGFTLGVPRLNLTVPGFADATATAAVDTDVGAAALRLRGGVVLGDPGGLNLTVTGDAALRVPTPAAMPLRDLPGSLLLPALDRADGRLRLDASLAAAAGPLGTLELAHLHASARLSEGSLEGRFRLSTALSVVSLEGRTSGTVTTQGVEDLRLSADLRLLGLPSLHVEGTGQATRTEASLSGTFSGAGPLMTSYVTGDFNLSSRTGVSGQAGVFGLTYTPGFDVNDPAPPSAGLRAVAGEPATPWAPSGLTIGASYFQYSHGNLNYLSAGFMPDLSSRLLTNPRFGVSLQGHF